MAACLTYTSAPFLIVSIMQALVIFALGYAFCYLYLTVRYNLVAKEAQAQDPEVAVPMVNQPGHAGDQGVAAAAAAAVANPQVHHVARNVQINGWTKGNLIGSGSHGLVYEAFTDDGFFFAVKEVLLTGGTEHILSLEHEIHLLTPLVHPNIVRYLGTDRRNGKLCIFLELAKGSLEALYRKYRLKESQVSAYTRQILNGLCYLHRERILHRDIKCSNILIHENGSAKLSDFGCAKKISSVGFAASTEGSVHWMAPEVVRANPYSYPADIWSLGCTVLEMLTGELPYRGLEQGQAIFRIGNNVPPDIPTTVSEDARDFVSRCTQIDPNDRPSAAELVQHPFVQSTI